MARTVAEKRAAFRALHESGCFALPNAWDRGSARMLAGLGFAAIASTSSGFAWTRGRPDGAVDRDTVLAHLTDLVGATDLPVNADFENGYGADPDEVAASVRLAVGTGVAGLSVEDSTGDQDDPLFDLEMAVARLRSARAAIDATGEDVLLVGRAEGFLWGRDDLDDVLARLRAYAEAGADCLYAPGISTPEQVAAVVRAVAPKPVNVLVGAAGGFTMAGLADLGVRRVSVGGALARAAWAGFVDAARDLADHGSFAGLKGAAAGGDLNGYFATLPD